jgi:malate dehydrogenase
MCLLLALDDNVAELCVQDVTMAMFPAPGVAADLSHIERKCKVKSYAIDPKIPAVDQLKDCLTGCHLVMVPAGVPRKPGMTRDDLFGINAGIAKGIVDACATYCPEAMIGLIVNPVNSIVPAMCELYKKKGLDPKRIVGVTTLDCVRANKFVGEKMGVDPADVDIPVIGGHAGASILPLFSQDATGAKIPANEVMALDKRVQDAGTEVVNAKDGKGSATLSMAYAGARLGKAILSGLAGNAVTECAYVVSDESVSELPYFSTKVTFGLKGIETVHPIGPLNEHEKKRLEEATKQLKTEIDTGLKYAARMSA